MSKSTPVLPAPETGLSSLLTEKIVIGGTRAARNHEHIGMGNPGSLLDAAAVARTTRLHAAKLGETHTQASAIDPRREVDYAAVAAEYKAALKSSPNYNVAPEASLVVPRDPFEDPLEEKRPSRRHLKDSTLPSQAEPGHRVASDSMVAHASMGIADGGDNPDVHAPPLVMAVTGPVRRLPRDFNSHSLKHHVDASHHGEDDALHHGEDGGSMAVSDDDARPARSRREGRSR